MKRVGIVLWGALATAGALTGPARAGEPEPARDPIDVALERADRHFVAGELEQALAVLAPACSGSKRPQCAFSLGAIHHGLGHCPEALAYYRSYRELAPRGAPLDEVKAALEEVEGRCGDEPPAPAPSGAANAPVVAEPAPGAAVMAGTGTAGAGTAGADGTRVAGADATGVAGAGLARAALEPEAAPSSEEAPRSLSSPPSSMTSRLMVGSFALSGAAAIGGVVFGVLAAKSARECRQARVYSDEFRSECEEEGPRYQGLWQGLAVASASFLGIGVTLWWLDESSSATVGVSGAGAPVLRYQRDF